MPTATVEKPLRHYEAVIILHPDVNEAEQKNFFKRNQSTIQSFGGTINHIDTWGKRRLGNSIKKMRLGSYFHTTFEAKGDCVTELERLMRIDDRVLRFIHVKLDERKSLSSHVDEFHKTLAEAHKREQEKEAKAQARRAAFQGSRGPREVNYEPKRSGGGRHSEDEESGEEI
jgi:small subunit ribosomal protein S6